MFLDLQDELAKILKNMNQYDMNRMKNKFYRCLA